MSRRQLDSKTVELTEEKGMMSIGLAAELTQTMT